MTALSSRVSLSMPVGFLTGVNTVLTQFHHETREQAQSGLRATVKDERFVISTGLAVIVFVILVTLLVLRMLPP